MLHNTLIIVTWNCHKYSSCRKLLAAMSFYQRDVALTWQKYTKVQNQLSNSSDMSQDAKCLDTALYHLKYIVCDLNKVLCQMTSGLMRRPL